jgi:hypothetical protein
MPLRVWCASEQWKEKNERNRVITAHPTTRSSHQLSLSTKGGKARSIPFSGSHAGRERRQNEEKDKKTEAGDVKRNKRLIKEQSAHISLFPVRACGLEHESSRFFLDASDARLGTAQQVNMTKFTGRRTRQVRDSNIRHLNVDTVDD